MAKKSSLFKTVTTIVTLSALTLSVAVGAILSRALRRPKFSSGETEVIDNSGNGGDYVAKSIDRIENTASYGQIDEYTIFYTDDTTSTFIVTNGVNGQDGEPGIQGFPGVDGHTPEIKIGTNGNWFIDGLDTGEFAQGPQGEPGITPHIGSNGNWWIGEVDTEVQAIGRNGKTPLIGANGHWWIGGTDTGVSAYGQPGPEGPEGPAGRGIQSIEKTDSQGLIDTYTITYTDGTTSEFLVTNGANGETAAQGLPGQDGRTPVITIGSNGNWFVDGVDTEVAAQGPQGPQGEQGQAGNDGLSLIPGEGEPTATLGKNGDSYVDTQSWNYYVKENDAWVLKGNIKGESNAGNNGLNGKSAYEIAVDNGYTGTEAEWLASLIGEAGANGDIGNNGKSAYELAVENGFTGTEEQWLATLIGPEGAAGAAGQDGKSVYELAVENGFTGSLDEWLTSLVGEQGQQGQQGEQGQEGKSAYELAVENGYTGTLEQWLTSLAGEDGVDGVDGVNGKSAYDLAVEHGFSGTEEEWLASLIGQDGAAGAAGQDGKSAYELAVENGFTGTITEWMDSLIGQDGADGSALRTGNGEPENDLGLDGDSFVDLESYNFYVKEDGAWVLKGNIKGANGLNGISIVSVEKTNTEDLIDTYTITYSDGNTTTFTVTNGVQGQDGNTLLVGTGAPTSETTANVGDSYIDVETWKLYVKGEENWTDKGSFKGDKGDQGEQGEQGVSITDIAYDSSSGLVDTYLISYSDGTNDTFAVTNGQDGTSLKTGYGNPNIASVDDPATAEDETRDDPVDGIEGDSFLDLHNWDYYVLEEGSEGLEWVFKGNIHNVLGTYQITFNTDGGSAAPDTQIVDAGSLVGMPSEPSKEDWIFQGWYTSDGTRWEFDKDVASHDMTLIAHWAKFKVVDGVIVESTASGDVVIPTHVEGQMVIAIGNNVFKDNASITSVTIPNTVTYIGNSTFKGCTGLTSIAIPRSVISIGDSAFENCTGFTSIVVPENVSSIGNSAFKGCTNAVYILVMDSVKIIGNNAFENCSSATNVVISKNIEHIGSNAFKGCDSLELLQIPAFENQAGELSSDILLIGSGAPEPGVADSYELYVDADTMTAYTQTTPGSGEWKMLGNMLFTGHGDPITQSGLGDGLYFDLDTNKVWSNMYSSEWQEMPMPVTTGHGVPNKTDNPDPGLYVDEDTETVYICLDPELEWTTGLYGMVVGYGEPTSETPFAMNAYLDLETYNLYTFYPGASIPWRFLNCLAEGSVELYTWFGESSFSDLSNSYASFKTIIFSGGTKISGQYLSYWSNLETLIIKEGITEIGFDAFLSCGNLVTVELPKTLEIIGPSAFEGCDEITKITLPENLKTVGESAFRDCVGLINLTISSQKNDLLIDQGAFYYCYNLDKVVFEDGEGKITLGTDVFNACYRLTEVYLSPSVLNIPLRCFDSEIITTFVVPSSIVFDNVRPFDCAKIPTMTLIVVDDSVDESFKTLESLNIIFANNYSTLEDNLFKDFTNLKSVILPYNLNKIGDSTFQGCTSLASIYIPRYVTHIGTSAFEGCSSISYIAFEEQGPEKLLIYPNAFKDCTSLVAISIPDRAVGMWQNGNWLEYCFINILEGCTSLETLVMPLVTDYELFSRCFNDTYYWGQKNNGTVPSSLKTVVFTESRYKHYGDDWRAPIMCHCDKLITVIFPECVKNTGFNYNINRGTFMGCSSLKNVSFPGLTRLGRGTFDGCTSLETVTLPDCLKSIGTGFISDLNNNYVLQGECFRNCSSLKSIVIPDGVIEIAVGSFTGCDSLEYISVPFLGDGVTPDTTESIWRLFNTGSITASYTFEHPTLKTVVVTGGNGVDGYVLPERAFWHSSTIENIVLSNKITKISNQAFEDCFALKNIIIPSSITSIGEDAFKGCSSLKSLVLPNSIVSIGSGALEGCTALESLTAPYIGGSSSENNYLGYIFGVETKNDRTEYNGKISHVLKEIIITDSCPTIEDYAFAYFDGVVSVNLPNTYTSIGDFAFYNCSSLKEVNFSASLTDIGASAFEDCINLREVSFSRAAEDPAKVDIGNNAFKGCTTLIKVINGKAIKTLGSYAFVSCEELENINLSNCTAIGDYAFKDCACLRSVIMPTSSSYTSVGTETFSNCYSLSGIKLSSYVTEIGTGAFENCYSITTIDLRNVKNIKDSAFQGCSSLDIIHINIGNETDGYLQIESNAFLGCDAMTTIYIWDITNGNDYNTWRDSTNVSGTGNKPIKQANGNGPRIITRGSY